MIYLFIFICAITLCGVFYITGFKEGVKKSISVKLKWLESRWHGPKEEPNPTKCIIVLCNNNCSPVVMDGRYIKQLNQGAVTAWAYVDDIIKATGGQQS